MPCWEFPPVITGGLGVACEGLAQALRQSADVTVVTPSEIGPSAYAGAYEGELKARVHEFQQTTLQQAGDFDLLHAHDWMSLPAAMEFSKVKGVPYIAHMHSFETDRAGAHGHEWIQGIEREGMRQADRVIVVSHQSAITAVQHYGVSADKLHVVHNGIHPLQPWRNSSSRPLVAFIGRMTSQKGPDVFLEMVRFLAPRFPAVDFVMAGVGDMLESLKARAHQHGLAHRIRFTGFLSRAEIHCLMAKTDLCCMPSRAEPFGLVALEAAQFGVPTILSSCAGVREVLPSNPVATSADPHAFAEQAARLLAEDSLRRSLHTSLQSEAARATWQKAASQVLRIYHHVLNPPPDAPSARSGSAKVL